MKLAHRAAMAPEWILGSVIVAAAFVVIADMPVTSGMHHISPRRHTTG